MLNNYEAIIFDLDGTLWDSTHQVVNVWNRVLEKHPGMREPVTQEEAASWMGKTPDEIAVVMLPEETEEVAKQIMDECCIEECVYLAEYGGRLYGDVRAVMETLKQRYRLFIVSNCQSGYIQAFLKYHQLEDLFEDFEMSGQTGLPKAENIRLIMERNQVESAVYVGDTEGDENAAHEAGIPFIHAAYGFGKAKNPEGTIRSLNDLVNEN